MPIGTGEFDPAGHTLIISGIKIEGYGESEAIAIKPVADHRGAKQGLDKRVVSNKTNRTMADVEITLIETSPAHKKLLALFALDKARIGGAGVGRFDLTDLINGINETSQKCWIKRRPDRVIGGEVPEYKWMFLLSDWDTEVRDAGISE